MYSVRLLPSGHTYRLQANDTLLEGALRAGLAPNYGCSSGNCGLCKARLVSGQVVKARPHDFVLSSADKALGYVLMCSSAPATDLVLEAGEARAPHEIPRQRIVARVRALTPLNARVTLLHLQTPRTQRLRFLAGQDVVVTVGDARAQLPLASCPCDDRNLQFHIADDGGAVARQVATLRLGDPVTVEGPIGEFTLVEPVERPAVFIAGETGFAPIKSLIEHLIAVDEMRPIDLYWLAADGGHYMNNLCRSWADALDAFRYLPVAASADGYDAALARIGAGYPDPAAHDMYIAGPPPLLAAARAQFAPTAGATLRLATIPPDTDR